MNERFTRREALTLFLTFGGLLASGCNSSTETKPSSKPTSDALKPAEKITATPVQRTVFPIATRAGLELANLIESEELAAARDELKTDRFTVKLYRFGTRSEVKIVRGLVISKEGVKLRRLFKQDSERVGGNEGDWGTQPQWIHEIHVDKEDRKERWIVLFGKEKDGKDLINDSTRKFAARIHPTDPEPLIIIQGIQPPQLLIPW